MRKFLPFVFIAVIFAACNPTEKSAEEHIQEAIQYHGGNGYSNLEVEFKFRDKDYKLYHNNGIFKYERIFIDSTGQHINDILDNDGFKRLIDGENADLSTEDSAAYANSVNSVHYFALLPYNLNDAAVIATNKDDALINGEAYKTIEVKFKQKGGGTDYEDIFMFWFNTKTYDMDYFAYSYHTNGGGVRFRESINSERVNGVIFRDYNNYKVEKGTDLTELPALFESGELELLSKIDLEFQSK
ncbi:DUF6503 family protein [Marivirga arenosa]|uniref:DUF6503 family protein n=1 Tax=Marivirga arenosa TaxID=3059076 RepID=A0AA49GIP7_9BACT|nr:DUF6503 family protein [Marivirga sp. ABR2-2]WKK85978.2 DUF6503 family protein [Marivirga sp. ABR2-2]